VTSGNPDAAAVKVWLHIALSIIALNVAAPTNSGKGLANLRRCVA
jgi:hypothetical protein